MTMDQFIGLLRVLGQYTWPVLALIAFLKLLPSLRAFLSRDKVKLRLGKLEVSAEQVTQSLTVQMTDLQNKVVALEQSLKAVDDAFKPDESIFTDESIFPVRRGDRYRILWVDDVPANNAIQIEKLMSDGLWVDVASETEQAVEMLRYTQFDLIISDMGRVEHQINRPNAGVLLILEVRKKNNEVPIAIFASSHAVEQFGQEALKAGATYVTDSTVSLYQIIAHEMQKHKNAD